MKLTSHLCLERKLRKPSFTVRLHCVLIKHRDIFSLMSTTTNNISVLRRKLLDPEPQHYLVWRYCDVTVPLHKHGFIFWQWRCLSGAINHHRLRQVMKRGLSTNLSSNKLFTTLASPDLITSPNCSIAMCSLAPCISHAHTPEFVLSKRRFRARIILVVVFSTFWSVKISDFNLKMYFLPQS